MKEQSQIVERMRRYIEECGLSQRDFAALLGCSQGAVSQWLGYKRRVSTEFFLRFQNLMKNKKTSSDENLTEV